ncbi:uncharacterized protein LOC119596719 [Penaeus monodon]|uniref:uncharacterized protein LOC119596719 n=1 Tax=Penaeus monodon TaxID=6687 RepID=UPI0018A71753|nr:uncharacterized protein LOC119596719 [Penaeus monodon]
MIVATLNVGTMTGRGMEIVDLIEHKNINTMCVPETKCKGEKELPVTEGIWIGGDPNGQVGMGNENAEDCMGEHGYGTRNEEGSHIVAMTQAFRLAMVNTYYTKKDQQLITYSGGNDRTQIDYTL